VVAVLVGTYGTAETLDETVSVDATAVRPDVLRRAADEIQGLDKQRDSAFELGRDPGSAFWASHHGHLILVDTARPFHGEEANRTTSS
jgi:hypothetical protein